MTAISPGQPPQAGPLQATSATFVGMPKFPYAARDALTNTQQRRNLAHATGVIRAKRARVVGEIERWEELRLAGSAAKDELLGHLAAYLEQLEANLVKGGAVVHWARDAAEANRIVVDLVKATGTEEVVKVKSMATQEIELNEVLEAAKASTPTRPTSPSSSSNSAHDKPSPHPRAGHPLQPRRRSATSSVREMGLVGRAAPRRPDR
jgi:L-lactate dehydrogenase complex protein LldF